MIRRPLRFIILLTGVALTSGYLWLNQGKAMKAVEDLRLVINGSPSSSWALALDKQVLISRRLPPTGIFDGAGQHQINIEPIPADLYERIRGARERVTQVYDDKAQTSRLLARKNFLVTQIADRRVYLVREDDARTIAAIVWNERRLIRDVIRCQNTSLCPKLRLLFGPGFDALSGPYLKSEINPGRRGMPRGRWLAGPVSELIILAKEERDILLQMKLLQIHPKQILSINGHPLRQATGKQQQSLVLGGKRFYPARYQWPVHLKTGRNIIKLRSSRWLAQKQGRSSGLSSYLLTLAIKARQPPRTATTRN